MLRELYYGVIVAMIGTFAWYPEGFGKLLARVYGGFLTEFLKISL